METLLTLQEIQNGNPLVLRELADNSDNTDYSIAINQMLAAREEYIAAGNKQTDTMKMHVKKAVDAYSRALTEDARLAHVRTVSAVVKDRGAELDAVKGKDVGKMRMGRLGAIWSEQWYRERG